MGKALPGYDGVGDDGGEIVRTSPLEEEVAIVTVH